MKMKKALTAVTVTGALGVTGVALGGCGATADLDPVAQAADTTASLPGMQIAIDETVKTPASAQSITLGGHGYVNEKQNDGVLVFDLSQIPGISSLGGGSKNLTIEYTYPVLYLNAPFLGSGLGGKSWLKVNLNSVLSSSGVDLSSLQSEGGLDPSQYLNFLRASSGGLQTVGTETIDGVPTTHYHAVIQLGDVADSVPSAQRAAVRSSIAILEKEANVKTFPVDVWIDANHRVRQISFTISPTTSAGTSTVSSTIDFTSFGPTPAVTPPPAGQVYDATKLLAGAEGGSGSGL